MQADNHTLSPPHTLLSSPFPPKKICTHIVNQETIPQVINKCTISHLAWICYEKKEKQLQPTNQL